MGVVTRRTGLSPDVLRVWERRYAVVSPTRSDGGQRLYSADDIEKLRLLQRLVGNGHRIASIARLDVESLAALAREIEDGTASPAAGAEIDGEIVRELIDAVERLDAPAIDSLLRRSAMSVGIDQWIETVVGPMFETVGDRWHDGSLSPAHEHLATATARDVMAWVVRSFGSPSGVPGIVIATPAAEQHELGAMMAAVIAAEAGWRVHYLGPNVPAVDLANAARQIGAHAVALSVVHPDHASRTIDEVRQLRRELPPSVPIIVGGSAGVESAARLTRAGARIASDLHAFRRELAAIKPGE